jgi:hypothetical protein
MLILSPVMAEACPFTLFTLMLENDGLILPEEEHVTYEYRNRKAEHWLSV